MSTRPRGRPSSQQPHELIGRRYTAEEAAALVGPRRSGPTPGVEKRAYSPEEAGESLGISRAGIYRLLQTGDLRSVRVGRRRLIPAAELDRLLEVLLEEQDEA